MQVQKESTSYEMTEHYLVSFNTFYVSINHEGIFWPIR